MNVINNHSSKNHDMNLINCNYINDDNSNSVEDSISDSETNSESNYNMFEQKLSTFSKNEIKLIKKLYNKNNSVKNNSLILHV